MPIETITRNGKEFAVIPLKKLKRLLHDAEMLADVKAYDAAKALLAKWRRRTDPPGDHRAPPKRANPRSASGVTTASSPSSSWRKSPWSRAP